MEQSRKNLYQQFNCIYDTEDARRFTSIKVLRSSYAGKDYVGIDYSEHKHSFNEIHISLSGKMSYYFADKNETICLSCNEYIDIPPNMRHRFTESVESFERFVIAYENVSGGVSEKNLKKGVLPESVLTTVDLLVSGQNQFDIYDRYALIRSVATRIAYKNEIEQIKGDSSGYLSIYTGMILRYLFDNKMVPLTADNLIRYCNCCARHLNRVLNRDLGTNMREMLKKHRLDLISYYLQNSDKPLKEIAELSGFSNEYTMSRFFTKEMKTPPGIYRRSSV